MSVDGWDDPPERADPGPPAHEAEASEAPGPSWAPVDLAAYLDGTYTPETPTMMPRSDGVCLLYPGRTHSFHGESESGNPWWRSGSPLAR